MSGTLLLARGESFIAFEYSSNTSDNSCLKGKSQNTLNIQTIASPPDSGYDRLKWEYSSGKPPDFSKWYQLNISQLPDFSEKKTLRMYPHIQYQA